MGEIPVEGYIHAGGGRGRACVAFVVLCDGKLCILGTSTPYGFGGLARVERRGVPELMYCETGCCKTGFIAERSS